MLFAVTDETLVGSTAALAITAALTAVREVVGWLRDRDAHRFNTEKALLAQRVEDVSARLTRVEAENAELRAEVKECKEDRSSLRDELNDAKRTLEAIKAREVARHPEMTDEETAP